VLVLNAGEDPAVNSHDQSAKTGAPTTVHAELTELVFQELKRQHDNVHAPPVGPVGFVTNQTEPSQPKITATLIHVEMELNAV